MPYGKDDFFGHSIQLSQLKNEDGGGWIATVKELKGCVADGETADEALCNMKETLSLWLDVASERGMEVPKPSFFEEEQYSGRLSLSMPRSLHSVLAQQSEQEGVSLNQYIVSLLSYKAGVYAQAKR